MRCRPSGPIDAEIMIVGEAPGKEEELVGLPFIGASGSELRRMLKQSDIDPTRVRFTNVFMDRPRDNDITAFCAHRKEVGKDYALPPLAPGQYVRPEFLPELDRLREEIEAVKPRLLIPVGNTPAWALLRRTGISKLRGNVFPCELAPGFDCLPTFHPAAILRDWSLRVISIVDLKKAARYVREGLSRPRRELWLDPTRDEMEQFRRDHLEGARLISFDIETKAESITCISFAPDPSHSLCVPFYDPRKPGCNFWPTLADELWAWRWCQEVLESPVPKLGQNGLYDIQYLFRYGIKVRNYAEDTMIRHHALYPEMEKGLGFMGTLYTDEAPWKLMRVRNKDNFKLDDE